VLLHGLGSNERDLMAFAPYLDPRLTIVAYRAPLEYGFGGFSWFDIQWVPEGRVINETAALASRDLLISTLENLGQSEKFSKILIGGFSQGAMMSLGVALRRPDLVAGVLMMSGRAIPRFFHDEEPKFRGLPVLQQHGTFDDVLPIDEAREARGAIEARGADLTYREYPMGHEVTMDSLRDALIWVDALAFKP